MNQNIKLIIMPSFERIELIKFKAVNEEFFF